jgi:hypothetical protein
MGETAMESRPTDLGYDRFGFQAPIPANLTERDR